MKKWIGAFIFVIGILIASIYVFIPRNLTISEAILIPGTPNSISRGMLDQAKWPKWWPVDVAPTQTSEGIQFSHNGNKYFIGRKLYQGLEVKSVLPHVQTLGKISIIPRPLDSVAVKWQSQFTSSLNPFKRIQQYQDAVTLKQDMHLVLGKLKLFFEDVENVYNIPIERILVQDTILVASKKTSDHLPTIVEIYSVINSIRKYIHQEGGKETNSPMLNITQVDSSHYDMLVAVPVDKLLPEKGKFFQRKLVRGYLLATEVSGGNVTINNAIKELDNFILDYQKTKMAIPFQSLVTERINEPDTSKWITGIYYPIMR